MVALHVYILLHVLLHVLRSAYQIRCTFKAHFLYYLLQFFLVFSSAFIETNQINEGNSEAEQTQPHPEKRVSYDCDDNQVDEPEGCSYKVGYPEKTVVDIIDFNIGVCWLKNPLLLLWILIEFYPPPQPCKLLAVDVLIDPEIDWYE